MPVPLYESGAPLYDSSSNAIAHEDVVTSKPIVGGAEGGVTPTGNQVAVVDTKTGKTFGLDEAYLPEATAQGFKLETPEQKALREFYATHSGTSALVKAALEKFVDESTFGVGTALADAAAGDLDPLEKANNQRLLKQHKIANAVATGGGFLTSLAVGEELGIFKAAGEAGSLVSRGILGAEEVGGEAVGNALARLAPAGAEEAAAKLGPSFARHLVASGLGHAVEGAVLTAPRAMAEASLGDPEEAAETLLYGAGAGALFGMAGPAVKAIGKGIKAGTEATAAYGESLLKKAIPGAETGAEAVGADVLEAEAAGAKPGDVKSWAAGKLRDISDKQVIKSFNPLKKFSKKIYGIGENDVANVAREFDLMPKVGETAEDVFTKVDAARMNEGKAIGDFVQKTSGAAPLLEPEGIKAAVDGTIDALSEKYGGVAAKKFRPRLDKYAADFISEYPEGASINDLHKFQAMLGRDIPLGAKSEILSEAIGGLRRHVNEAMFTQMETAIRGSEEALAGEEGKAADLLAEFKQHRANYRALAALSETTEENIARGLANRGHSVTDYAGNIVGGLVGGAVGHAGIGALAGGAINKFGRLYGNRYVAQGAEALANWLESSAARNPIDAAGLLGIEQSQKYTKEMLDEVAPSLSGESKMPSSLEGGTTYAALEFIRHFTEGNAESAKKVATFKTLATDLASLAADPLRMQAKIQEAVAPYSKDAPQISAFYGQRLTNALSYLHDTMPKNPNAPNPFVDREWKPSDAEMALWARRWHTTLDPFSAVQRVVDGTLNAADVETLAKVYPKLYQRVVQAVVKYGSEGDVKPLGYAQRLKLSMLLGAPSVEPSLAGVGRMQAMYGANAAKPEETANASPPKGPRAKLKPDSFAQQTDIQRIAAK